MCYCDAETPSFINQTFPKAAKTHFCGECGVAIRANTRYERSSGLWGGDFNSYVRCMECRDLNRFMHWWSRQSDGCYCEVFEDLGEAVQEEWRGGQAKLIGIAYVAFLRRGYRDREERMADYARRRAERAAKKLAQQHVE